MEKLHHNWVEKQVQDSRPKSTGMVRDGTGTRFVNRLFYHRKLGRDNKTIDHPEYDS
jgi:hypothetical protein